MNRQQKLKEFFHSEYSSSSVEPSDEDLYEPGEDELSKKKRGAPKEPLKWTRIFKVTRDLAQDIKIFNVEQDELKFLEKYNKQNPRLDQNWKPLFDPETYKDQQDQMRCKDYELDRDALLDYAKKVSQIRQDFQEKADRIKLIEDEDQLIEQDKQIKEPTSNRRPYSTSKTVKGNIYDESRQSYIYRADRPKKRHLKNLTNSDLTNIAHDAVVKLRSNNEIADIYNINSISVSQLVSKLRRNDHYLKDKFEKEDLAKKRNDLIKQVSESFLNTGQHIWRASIIQFKLQEEHQVEASLSQINNVLKNQLQMGFKKIKTIPFLGNAQRCLVMRHLFAIKMIEVLLQKTTVWNYDESFLNESFFVRRKWCKKDQQNSIPVQAVSPRISILLIMNNHGDAYLCLSQSKTDSQKVMLFFEHFFKKLDSDQPDWKENSIFLMDNASYHKSEDTMPYFHRNKVPVFYTAPYSYDAAVAEMFFSYLKSQDLNINNLPLGKRYVIILILIFSDHFQMQWESLVTESRT